MIDGSGGMTVTGELLGTPVYMSPEQARARTDEIDHRTDVYSLGATLYEMLTLRPPFAGGEFAEVYRQILTNDPDAPRTRNAQIPKDLETIVLKAMEKEPASRYADAADLAQDLRAFADGRAIGARRAGFLEKAWRRAKRHKALTTMGALLLLALGAGGLSRTVRTSRKNAASTSSTRRCCRRRPRRGPWSARVPREAGTHVPTTRSGAPSRCVRGASTPTCFVLCWSPERRTRSSRPYRRLAAGDYQRRPPSASRPSCSGRGSGRPKPAPWMRSFTTFLPGATPWTR